MAAKLLAVTERKDGDEVPSDTMLRGVDGVAAKRGVGRAVIIQKPHAGLHIGGRLAGKELIQAGDVSGRLEGIRHVVEQLVTEPLIETALNSELNAVVPGETDAAE